MISFLRIDPMKVVNFDNWGSLKHHVICLFTQFPALRHRQSASIREKSKISLDLVNLDNGIETEAITGPVYNLLRALISSNGLL